ADRAAEQGCHAGDKRTTNCGEHEATEHGAFAGAAGHGSRCATNSFAPYDADDGNNVQHDIHTFLLDVFREDEVQGSSKMTPSSSSASFSSNSFSRRTSSSFTPIASAIVLQVSSTSIVSASTTMKSQPSSSSTPPRSASALVTIVI